MKEKSQFPDSLPAMVVGITLVTIAEAWATGNYLLYLRALADAGDATSQAAYAAYTTGR